MNAIWQVLLALLAVVGLLALGWLLFGKLVTPVGGGGGGPVYAVVPAAGDGEHLEQDVKGLLWLRGGELARFTVVIADDGLDEDGLRLAREPGYAAHLARAEVSTVFLQFDGLEDSIYRTLRGADLTQVKLDAIQACREAGLPVVLVPTVAPGINDQALGDILRFALSQAPHVRGVHIQPISYFGRCSLEAPEKRLTIPGILRRIEEQTRGLMKYADFGGGGAESPYCSFHASYLHRENGSLKALPRRKSQCCCTKSSEARDYVAQQWSGKVPGVDGDPDTASLDAFLQQVVENTFTVSGMVFQDADNLDLDRLRRCYICEVDSQYGMVPFCAYNLTDRKGRALYRKS